ncbi:MAG: hypothetical protein ACYDAJ_10535 [Nitrosotalea sp.]
MFTKMVPIWPTLWKKARTENSGVSVGMIGQSSGLTCFIHGL